MTPKFMKLTTAFFVFSAIFSAISAHAQYLTTYEQKKQEVNNITVSIVVSGMRCTCARFAEDIRNVVNDVRPGGIRVLPVLGVGGIQNLQDVLFLKGIDMGAVDQDHIEFLKKKNPDLYGDLDDRIRYVAKLFNSELHVVARKEFKTLSDLRGRKVSFNLENSQPHIAADIIFEMAGIETVRLHMDNDEGLEKLVAGEIDAHLIMTGAPQSGLSRLRAGDGVHFISISDADLPSWAQEKLYGRYLPADLTHAHYPELVPEGTTVPTIASRTALAVYNWPEGSFRYRKMKRFIQNFFPKIEEFNDESRHPKWAEVNLNAKIPGWKRFKPAQDWLNGNRQQLRSALIDQGPSDDRLKEDFERFLASSRQSTNSGSLSKEERRKLYKQFQQFLAFRNTVRSRTQ